MERCLSKYVYAIKVGMGREELAISMISRSSFTCDLIVLERDETGKYSKLCRLQEGRHAELEIYLESMHVDVRNDGELLDLWARITRIDAVDFPPVVDGTLCTMFHQSPDGLTVSIDYDPEAATGIITHCSLRTVIPHGIDEEGNPEEAKFWQQVITEVNES